MRISLREADTLEAAVDRPNAATPNAPGFPARAGDSRRAPDALDPEAKWIMFVVEETGLPAIATVLAALPAGMTASAIVEVHDAAKEQLFTRGYWKQGVGNHPDHDTGED